MTTSDTPSQGIGLTEAASQFEAILSGKSAGKQTPEPPSEENASADDAEALEATSNEDETPEDDEAPAADDAEEASDEGSEDEEAAAEDEGEADDEADEGEQLYTVKIDGKEEQVPLKELLNGYQRTADYTRKTMALREERNQLMAEYQQVQQERAQYSELLNALASQISETVAQEPDWDALYAENPLEYVRQKDLYREQQEQLMAAQSEMQRLASMQVQEEAAALTAKVQNGRKALAEVVPAWRDEKVWKADKAKIREYGKKIGFTDAELDRAYDHRAVMLLYNSMRYEALRANRPQPKRNQAPALARPNAPQTLTTRKASDVARDKQRLAKTGSVKDAAKLFERIL